MRSASSSVLRVAVGALAALVVTSCSDTTSTAPLRSCATVDPAWRHVFPGRVPRAVANATGGCGDVLVAFDDGVDELTSDGIRCARHLWPKTFAATVPLAKSRAVPGGILIANGARQVVKVTAQATTVWLDLPAAPSIDTITDFDESPCGERYAVDDYNLWRLDDSGVKMWSQPGTDFGSIAATCSGVFAAIDFFPDGLGGTATHWSPTGAANGPFHLTNPPYDIDAATVIGHVGDLLVASVDDEDAAMRSSKRAVIVDAAGTLQAQIPLAHCDVWDTPQPVTPCVQEDALSAVEWPAGQVAWIVQVNSAECPGKGCSVTYRIESRSGTGQLLFSRTLTTTGETVSQIWPTADGGLVLSGTTGAIDGLLVRLPACALNPEAP